MTRKKIALTVAYVTVFLELVTYLAHDTGHLREGRVYWVLLYGSSLSLLAAVIWIFLDRQRQS